MARQQSFHRICCRTGTAWHSKQSAVYAGTEQLGPERIAAKGPDIRLDPQKALSLGMVIHELATNDAKYGKLTHADGRVSINWEMSTADVVIEWQEHDGPAVSASTGFGLSLLEGEIGYRYGGTVETAFEPTGLRVRITLPTSR